MFATVMRTYNIFCLPQADSPFWKKKPQDKPTKPARTKTKVTKRPAKKKTIESADLNLDDDKDDDELEVELDSLGSFFIHLIDNDFYQDDAEASRADDAEVITLSSGSEPLPTQKTRQASEKVRFSHPLAHLDPNFLLKKQQHEARRTTRHSGGVITSSGLPNTPACTRRLEALHIYDILHPKAGHFRQPLNPSDSNYQGTSHSSSGESTGTQIQLSRLYLGKYIYSIIQTLYLIIILTSLCFLF